MQCFCVIAASSLLLPQEAPANSGFLHYQAVVRKQTLFTHSMKLQLMLPPRGF
jgi:hypothetical protein